MKQLAIPLSNQNTVAKWLVIKIKISDGTTSHSTRPPKNGSQVAGYKSDKAREKNRSAAYVGICKQDFSRATQYDDEMVLAGNTRSGCSQILDFERYL